jgi:hypothetical protein
VLFRQERKALFGMDESDVWNINETLFPVDLRSEIRQLDYNVLRTSSGFLGKCLNSTFN